MRIGSVPYLNARPLVDWFHTPEGRNTGVEVVYAVPSQLARMVQQGEVACATVSSIELFRNPSWQAVPQIAIASTGRVLSVRLFCKVPVEAVRSVALDTSSLTSAALVKVLFARRWGITPAYLPAQPDLTAMLQKADAALLIGDRGMIAPEDGLCVIDLGLAWYEWTGLPFVWALWLGQQQQITPRLIQLLEGAREWGTRHLGRIAQDAASRTGLDANLALRYLRDIMQYELTPLHQEGLHRFATECQQLGLISL